MQQAERQKKLNERRKEGGDNYGTILQPTMQNFEPIVYATVPHLS